MAGKEEGNDGRQPHVIDVPLIENVSVFFEATARTRAGFSLPHIQGAEHFAAELRKHEKEHKGAEFGPPWEKSRWYASAAILLSFSAMEAALDETEDDLAIPEALLVPIQRARFWDRVNAVLAFAKADPFAKGDEPYRSADLLQALRNGLAHPKAEWFDERTTHKKLAARVNGLGLPLSPFIHEPDKAFPLGCMSAGVAHWAADTARAFIREFRTRCGQEVHV